MSQTPYPVRVRGIDFVSVKACAAHFGIAPKTVYDALADGKVDGIGLGSSRRKSITLGGVHFPSMKAASLALGHYKGYVSSIMKHGSHERIERLEQEFQDYANRS